MNENDAISTPSRPPRSTRCPGSSPGNSGNSRSVAYSGNSGSTMPKPSRSMNTTRKTISIAERDAGAGEEGASCVAGTSLMVSVRTEGGIMGNSLVL